MIGQKLAVQDQLAQENAKLKEIAEHKDRLICSLGKDRDVLLFRLKENKDAASNNGQQSNAASATDRAMSTSFSEYQISRTNKPKAIKTLICQTMKSCY